MVDAARASSIVVSRMHTLRQTMLFADLGIRDSTGKPHDCHRAVLSSLSETCRVVVEDAVLREEDSKAVVSLGELSAPVVRAILDFAYAGMLS